MACQGTLFDEQLRARAEQATWEVAGLQDELTEARTRIAALERERETLRMRLATLERAERDAATLRRVRQGLGLPMPDDDDRDRLVKALTRLAAEVHPDRWQGSPVAEELTKRVLALRDTLTVRKEP